MQDRTWRKTRKPNPGSKCNGTDPNRNFGTGWGGRLKDFEFDVGEVKLTQLNYV